MDRDQSLKVAILQFLVDYGHFDKIQSQCSLYLSNKKVQEPLLTEDAERDVVIQNTEASTVYKISLFLDTFELLQFNALLGNLLLHHPSRGWGLFHDVIFAVVDEMKWLSLVSSTQLLLVLRLTALPDFPPYHVHHLTELPKLKEEIRFLTCTGVICSMSHIEKYTESACFHCPDTTCTNTRYIRCHTTGSTESTTMRNDLICFHCGSVLIEDVVHHSLADKMFITIISNEALINTGQICSKNIRYQGFTVILRDDLCGKIEMGGEYTILGVPVNKTELTNGHIIVHTTIEANNIYPVVSSHQSPSHLSPHIKDIFSACQYSYWTYSATLAYSFGAEVAPPGVFHRLKLVLLLSIVASKMSNRDKMIDVLVVGSEMVYVQQLLYYASSFSDRSILHGTGMSLCSLVRKEEGTQWIDAGSLLLARNGICLLRDIGQWKKDDREQLQHILEFDHVTAKTQKRSKAINSDSLDHMTWPLQCTLWMTCDCHVTGLGQSDETKHLHERTGLSKAFMDHCRLVLVTDPPTQENEEFIDGILSSHLLQQATQDYPIPLLSKQDFNEIFTACSQINVTLEPLGHELLRGYYLTSRRVRGSDTPLSALDTMISLTLAHAQINMRTKAIEEDAVLAILLYEETLVHRYGKAFVTNSIVKGSCVLKTIFNTFSSDTRGYSPLYVQCCPHVRDENIGTYMGKEMDDNMKMFHKQVKGFIKNHTHISHPHYPEE